MRSVTNPPIGFPLDGAAAAVHVVQGRTTSPTISAGGCAAMGVGCQVNLASGNLAVQAAPPMPATWAPTPS